MQVAVGGRDWKITARDGKFDLIATGKWVDLAACYLLEVAPTGSSMMGEPQRCKLKRAANKMAVKANGCSEPELDLVPVGVPRYSGIIDADTNGFSLLRLDGDAIVYKRTIAVQPLQRVAEGIG